MFRNVLQCGARTFSESFAGERQPAQFLGFLIEQSQPVYDFWHTNWCLLCHDQLTGLRFYSTSFSEPVR